MEKSLETLRHSQAKLAEVERINKKLNSQSHEDKKELFKLKEVSVCVRVCVCVCVCMCVYVCVHVCVQGFI